MGELWSKQEWYQFAQRETLTKYFAQEQRLDQVELCVRGVRESVADRRVVVQLRGRETDRHSIDLHIWRVIVSDKLSFCEINYFYFSNLKQNFFIFDQKKPAWVAAHPLLDLLQGQDCSNTLKMNRQKNKTADKTALCDAGARAGRPRWHVNVKQSISFSSFASGFAGRLLKGALRQLTSQCYCVLDQFTSCVNEAESPSCCTQTALDRPFW